MIFCSDQWVETTPPGTWFSFACAWGSALPPLVDIRNMCSGLYNLIIFCVWSIVVMICERDGRVNPFGPSSCRPTLHQVNGLLCREYILNPIIKRKDTIIPPPAFLFKHILRVFRGCSLLRPSLWKKPVRFSLRGVVFTWKPLFLSIDIERTQCRCWFFTPLLGNSFVVTNDGTNKFASKEFGQCVAKHTCCFPLLQKHTRYSTGHQLL